MEWNLYEGRWGSAGARCKKGGKKEDASQEAVGWAEREQFRLAPPHPPPTPQPHTHRNFAWKPNQYRQCEFSDGLL